MGTSLSDSTLLDSVRRSKHNIEHLQTFDGVLMYIPFSFLLFLHEITQKIKKLADMTVVITDKSPKQDANPMIGPEVLSDVSDYQTATYHNIHQVTGPNPTSIHTPDDVIGSSVAMETCQIKWPSKTGTTLSTLSSGLACAVVRHSECESLDMHTPHTMVTYLDVPVLQFRYTPS